MPDRPILDEMERKIEALSRELEFAKQREKTLQETEAYYRAFFEHGSDGIVVLDTETGAPIDFNDQVCRQLGYSIDRYGKITYVNPVCENIVGYKPEEMIGKSVLDFVYQGDHDKTCDGYQQVLGDYNIPSEYRVVHKSGDIVWVRSFSRPTINDGKITGIQGVVTNINDLKKPGIKMKSWKISFTNPEKWKPSGLWPGASPMISTIFFPRSQVLLK